MEAMLTQQDVFFTLTILTVLCALIVAPYTLTSYNTHWVPRWIRPDCDYLNRTYQYYYPAEESRVSLTAALFVAALTVITHVIYKDAYTIFPTDSILLFYATLMPAYLMHRITCFHKLNEFTPRQAAETTNYLNVYRIWKIVLLWLIALTVVIADVLYLVPLHWLSFFTSVMSGVAIYGLWMDIKREIRENQKALQGAKFKELYLELMPGSYYLTFAVLGIGLTQAALWLSNPMLLIGWVILVIAFTIIEYHIRFVSFYRTDTVEQWGEEEYAPLYPLEEELWIIRRHNEAALRKKNISCWVVIIEYPAMPGHYKIQLAANLEYKQREIALCHAKLLYIRRFDTVAEARRYAKSIDTSNLLDAKIQKLNPKLDNLNRQSARLLSSLNTMI